MGYSYGSFYRNVLERQGFTNFVCHNLSNALNVFPKTHGVLLDMDVTEFRNKLVDLRGMVVENIYHSLRAFFSK